MEIEPRSRVDVALPEKLGRNEIIAHLGQGGMAHVFLAVQRGPFKSTKLVVIKKLKPDAGSDQQFLDMFVDEARIAMRLSHLNVVTTFDFVANPGEFYLTMEFLEGLSLLQVLRTVGRENVPLDLHIWILSQVLAGLGYAHGLRDFDGTPLGIVHRDVTPSNVILTYGGEVKLVDFGIAKVAGAVAVTQSGTMKGKLGYVSPEQCLGRATDARSDLYSVGVMLWEAMARKRRSGADSPATVFQARIRGEEQPIDEVWLDAPASLARIARRALAFAPENRYSTALEFQRDLEEYLAGSTRPAVGSRVLADFMTSHCADKIEALRQTIESHVAGAPHGLRSVGPGQEVTQTSEGPIPIAPARGSVVTLPARPAARPEGRSAKHRLWIAGAVAAVVLATVTVNVLRGCDTKTTPMTATGRTPAPPPSRPNIAPVSPLPVKTAVGPTIEPKQAPRDVPLKLSRKRAARPTQPRAAAPAPSVRSPQPEGRKEAPPRAGAPDGEDKPGMDLRRPSPSKVGTRHIDEKDPYTP